jgi:hypothetical protein
MVSMELRIIARGLLAGDCIHLRSVWPVKVSHIHLPEPTFVRLTSFLSSSFSLFPLWFANQPYQYS